MKPVWKQLLTMVIGAEILKGSDSTLVDEAVFVVQPFVIGAAANAGAAAGAAEFAARKTINIGTVEKGTNV